MKNDYFVVKVEFKFEDDKGKIKTQKVPYLVDAMSVTEAEARMVQHLTERKEENFEIKSVAASSIAEVVMPIEYPVTQK